jgi:hypothetical protein
MPNLKQLENEFIILHNEIKHLNQHSKDIHKCLKNKKIKYNKICNELHRLRKKQTS